MTRKDYRLMVEAIGSGLNRAAWANETATGDSRSFHGEDLRVARLTARAIAEALAERLAGDNGRFDRERFMAAVDEVVGEQLPASTRDAA